MDMHGIPLLTLQLRETQHTLMTALMQHHEDIEKIVDEQFKQFIESGEMVRLVRQQANELIRAALASALKDAVNRAIWSQDVKTILQTDVQQALVKVLKEYYPWNAPPEDSHGG